MAEVIILRPEATRALRTKRIELEVADLHQMLWSTDERNGKNGSKSDRLPVDVRKMAALLGLQIEEVQELGGVKVGNPWSEADIEVQASLDRVARKVIMPIKGLDLAQWRYTLAHELCHLLIHSDPIHHRERPAARTMSRRVNPSRPEEERDAQIFAACFLMPENLTKEAFLGRFEAQLDGTVPHDDFAYYLSIGTRQKIHSTQLAAMPQLNRAALVAKAISFGGKPFLPMYELFQVSIEAMARRLLELGWVS
jgi:Zn-dependent peptidase ImmA (M78 family)